MTLLVPWALGFGLAMHGLARWGRGGRAAAWLCSLVLAGLMTADTARWYARFGWIDAQSGGVTYSRTRLDVEVDLSSRTLVVRRDGVVIRRATVGVGRLGSPTPTGHFAVTDKLSGPAYSAYYGCCILALSATQPNLPAGWTGGNRVAIHGTPSASDFGRAVSAPLYPALYPVQPRHQRSQSVKRASA